MRNGAKGWKGPWKLTPIERPAAGRSTVVERIRFSTFRYLASQVAGLGVAASRFGRAGRGQCELRVPAWCSSAWRNGEPVGPGWVRGQGALEFDVPWRRIE